MKHFTLTFLLLTSSIAAFATTWTVRNNGFSFNPTTLTIFEGDTVVFNIDGIHNAVEVSETTWNNNGTTPLAGGFAIGFGGGTVLPADLEVGTNFYVCQPHANGGMKGRIIVQATTAINDGLGLSLLNIYPNPSFGKVYLSLDKSIVGQNFSVDVFNLGGEVVFTAAKSETTETK
ncbi:MAG: plastocyanin/azurin family copper-binding protein, partial [Bacteroidota bacterium]|nr:plastocyanin/azurin family copper-binding protein [Bacteroidota bacterium]